MCVCVWVSSMCVYVFVYELVQCIYNIVHVCGLVQCCVFVYACVWVNSHIKMTSLEQPWNKQGCYK